MYVVVATVEKGQNEMHRTVWVGCSMSSAGITEYSKITIILLMVAYFIKMSMRDIPYMEYI